MDAREGTGLEIEIVAPPGALGDAISVMHAAFAQFSATGSPSGAMLETESTLADECARGTAVAVARRAGTAVAVVKHHAAPDGTLYFGRLGVVPAARGEGIAAALVDALRGWAREQGLAGLSCLVRAEESGSIAMYEQLGMEVVARGERVSRTGAVLAVVEMRDRADGDRADGVRADGDTTTR